MRTTIEPRRTITGDVRHYFVVFDSAGRLVKLSDYGYCNELAARAAATSYIATKAR